MHDNKIMISCKFVRFGCSYKLESGSKKKKKDCASYLGKQYHQRYDQEDTS